MYLERISGDNTGDVIQRRKKFNELVRSKITNLNKEKKLRQTIKVALNTYVWKLLV